MKLELCDPTLAAKNAVGWVYRDITPSVKMLKEEARSGKPHEGTFKKRILFPYRSARSDRTERTAPADGTDGRSTGFAGR